MDLFRIAMEYHSDGGSQLESSPFSLKSRVLNTLCHSSTNANQTERR